MDISRIMYTMTATEICKQQQEVPEGGHVIFKANMKNKHNGACKALICSKHKTKFLKGHTGHLALYSLIILNRHENYFS
jgi:hypothetical protein